MKTALESGIAVAHSSSDEHVPVVCPYTVKKNMFRFAQRNSSGNLERLAEAYKYATYTNFDDVDNPKSDVL